MIIMSSTNFTIVIARLFIEKSYDAISNLYQIETKRDYFVCKSKKKPRINTISQSTLMIIGRNYFLSSDVGRGPLLILFTRL